VWKRITSRGINQGERESSNQWIYDILSIVQCSGKEYMSELQRQLEEKCR